MGIRQGDCQGMGSHQVGVRTMAGDRHRSEFRWMADFRIFVEWSQNGMQKAGTSRYALGALSGCALRMGCMLPSGLHPGRSDHGTHLGAEEDIEGGRNRLLPRSEAGRDGARGSRRHLHRTWHGHGA